MNRFAQRWLAYTSVALIALACGEDPTGGEPAPDAGQSGQSTLLLTRVGNGILDVTQTETDDAGVASTEVTLGVEGTVTIRATSPGATSKAIWKINVVPVVKKLRIVPGTNIVLTDSAGTKAAITASPGQQ